MNDAQDLHSLLMNYTGTDNYYRHPFSPSVYTDGVRAFAQNAGGGAYWFLDIVLTEPVIRKAMRDEGLQIVTLSVDPEQRGHITVKRDTYDPVIFSRAIDTTDCPPGEWRFYFTDNVLMIPNEY
jgi:hypothetical protein